MIIGLIEIEEWSKSTQPVYLISSTSGGHRREMIKVYLIPPSTDLLPALPVQVGLLSLSLQQQ